MSLVAHPLEDYLRKLSDTRRAGSTTPETSHYAALENLLEAIGATLKPRVRCFQHPSHGVGIPDFGLYTAEQLQKVSSTEPLPGSKPGRGVVEAKPASDDTLVTADSVQVAKYWQVLVTNFRDFVLVAADAEGQPVKLEQYRLAPDEAAFWNAARHPRTVAAEQGEAFGDFLKRVMLHPAPLTTPKDVAWFLASYAREALRRVEKRKEVPALAAIRGALEAALGIEFKGEKGGHFFHSTLIQTLFYGIFSAWVLWTREHPPADSKARFDWRTAGYYLRVPVLAELFHQFSNPASLAGLALPEVLDWTGTVLNRIERAAFFAAFEEHHAVQYFYEPFLEAYDPELRKQLGVWYTPREVVRYMVARVDRVLREELDIADGLAAPNVYVLDPCCGTGSYLIEVLRRIDETLRAKGGDALTGQEIKRAAQERVFGFELLPAPFVVAHLQIGLMLRELGAPLADGKNERAAVYLTNALTGWEPPDGSKPQKILGFPELLEERETARHVKRETDILVVLGNPPYNAFAGVSSEQEQGIVDVYKDGLVTKWGIKKFNLDDMYVRFFRLAERRIAERTKRGIVCFISNFSYLDQPSYVVMRQRMIKEFDQLWFDCMNGDSRETGKVTPEGKPDPSVFSTEYNREGIRVGTSIALMVRKERHETAGKAFFREFWGSQKRANLLESLDDRNFYSSYDMVNPIERNRFAFVPSSASAAYAQWPKISELALRHFNGPVERRALALISIDREALEDRMKRYFDATVKDSEIADVFPSLMMTGNRIVGPDARKRILSKFEYDDSRIVKYPFKPFDSRWCYLDNLRPLFSEPSPELLLQRDVAGNEFFIARDTADKMIEGVPFFQSTTVCDYDCISGHARLFPSRLKITAKKVLNRSQSSFPSGLPSRTVANLSVCARAYVIGLGIADADSNAGAAALIWRHALAIGYAPLFLTENGDGIRDDWPRVPLPASKELLLASAELGRKIAALLDADAPVEGVTTGNVRADFGMIGVISREGGGTLDPAAGDLAVTAGWGHGGKGGAVMPGKGRVVLREYSAKERDALAAGVAASGLTVEQAFALLGARTVDVYLNNVAYWRNVPERVWAYTIGGYQVIKKWLSYRERELLGRSLKMEEARLVMAIARRIAAILLLGPELDANYAAVKAAAYPWPAGK